MTSTGKITRAHLERLAVVYVRQSSLAQVRDHTESTARQYALVEEAVRLGWDSSRTLVIDADLGTSGRTAAQRMGFKELVGRVCLGEAGAILGLEVSRLARSTADLQRLLELCSLTNTLVIDGDGIYDLGCFNDRLLLGLKGTMSEAELHILAGRLQGARLAAAQRGELRVPLPTGYVHDDDGRVVFDHDEEVRAAVAGVFVSFDATGSACAVVGAFAGRRFPKRVYGGVWAGEIRWGRLTHSRVLDLLANPVYAGAYVFGRYRSRRTVEPDGTIRGKRVELPAEQWQVLIRDHHPGYINWETFAANKNRLAANCTSRGARPVREGGALLQGVVFCGGCGWPMSTSYRKGAKAVYSCSRSRAERLTTPRCRSINVDVIDRLVAQRLLTALAPEEIAMALAAADEVAERRANRNRALELRVERARYEAARAERAFHYCDPDNRLVARSLERRWEEKLGELAEAERELACRIKEPVLPSGTEIEVLATDLPRLWALPTTSDRDRKRLLRTLIGDVTLIAEPLGKKVRIGIRWRSGASEELLATRPPPAHDLRRTAPAAVELARRLGKDRNDTELAGELNRAGFKTGAGHPFDMAAVRRLRQPYGIARVRPLEPGELSVRQLAARLGVSVHVIHYWLGQGWLVARRTARNRWCIPFTPAVERACHQRMAVSCRIKTSHSKQVAVEGAV